VFILTGRPAGLDLGFSVPPIGLLLSVLSN
jgi:hypothetical protein